MVKNYNNVYVETQSFGCNYGLVETSEGIVMIDTPYLPSDAIKWRKEVLKKGDVRYVINTEHHIDHISGNYFFSGLVVSHEGIKEMFTAPISQVVTPDALKIAQASNMETRDYIIYRLSELDKNCTSLIEKYALRPPTITFSERLTIYLGKHTFELFHLPGHTPYQVGVYVPEEKVFFSGDNVTNGVQPSLVHCYPIEWIESLKRILEFDLDFIIPGHGDITNKNTVQENISFIQKCVDVIREAIDNKIGKEELYNNISFNKGLKALHPGLEQQKGDITRLYEVILKYDSSRG